MYLPAHFLNTVEYGELSARLIGSVRLSSAAASPHQKARAALPTWYFGDMSLVKTLLIHQEGKQITAGGKKIKQELGGQNIHTLEETEITEMITKKQQESTAEIACRYAIEDPYCLLLSPEHKV